MWLGASPEVWRENYGGWKALEKLEYVDALMKVAAVNQPAVTGGRLISEARRLRRTLRKHYAARRKLYAQDLPDFYDSDLRALFRGGDPNGKSAAGFMRGLRKTLEDSTVLWTAQRKYVVSDLVGRLIKRAAELKLHAPPDSTRILCELSAYLASLVTNQMHTGKFKRTG